MKQVIQKQIETEQGQNIEKPGVQMPDKINCPYRHFPLRHAPVNIFCSGCWQLYRDAAISALVAFKVFGSVRKSDLTMEQGAVYPAVCDERVIPLQRFISTDPVIIINQEPGNYDQPK